LSRQLSNGMVTHLHVVPLQNGVDAEHVVAVVHCPLMQELVLQPLALPQLVPSVTER